MGAQVDQLQVTVSLEQLRPSCILLQRKRTRLQRVRLQVADELLEAVLDDRDEACGAQSRLLIFLFLFDYVGDLRDFDSLLDFFFFFLIGVCVEDYRRQ